jgi:hypothetical protein
MPHSGTSSEVAARLLRLTLALEDAVRSSRYEEVEALFCERASCLSALESIGLLTELDSTIEQIRQCETRVLGLLSDVRGAAVSELEQAKLGRAAVRTYGRALRPDPSFHQMG